MSKDLQNLTSFQEKIEYTFLDSTLLDQALCHPSKIKNKNHFERLEFLGDRVLGVVIATWLFKLYPLASEGDLTKYFSNLVSRQALYHVAQFLSLEDYLTFIKEKNHKKNHETILSDALEAIIAALFLDGGLDVAQKFIHQFWLFLIKKLTSPQVDAKSALQEWAQSYKQPIPLYHVVSIQGPSHEPEFEVTVQLHDNLQFTGRGPSRREAEKKAAYKALQKLIPPQRPEPKSQKV